MRLTHSGRPAPHVSRFFENQGFFLPCGNRPAPDNETSPRGNAGTSMISKSQEETEVSLRLEEWALEAGVERLN